MSRREGHPVTRIPDSKHRASRPGVYSLGSHTHTHTHMAGFAPGTGTSVGSIFIKLAGDARARFAEVAIFDNDTVTRVAERASQKRGWNVDAAYVELFLVPAESEDEPSAAEEEEALKQPRLGVGRSLSRAGIASGAWVIARLTDPSAAAPGECVRETVKLLSCSSS